MNLSGIVVSTTSECLPDVAQALALQPGVEVHNSDAASGRIIVMLEAENIAAEVEGFKRIQALPQVIRAELVYHYFGEANTPPVSLEANLASALAQLAPAAPRVADQD